MECPTVDSNRNTRYLITFLTREFSDQKQARDNKNGRKLKFTGVKNENARMDRTRYKGDVLFIIKLYML